MRFVSAAMIVLLAFCIPALGQDNTKTFTYTKTKQADLEIVVHYPPGWKETDKRPGIVFFFGGGWENGTINAFKPQAEYLASRGMVTARADYRVKSRHGVTPKECVDDARTAIRWFRQNAAKLGVDPDKIVASGGSAGGHIAACTTLMPASESKDETVSCKANALLLFNPVLRFGPQMLKKVDNDEAVGKAISPILYLAKDSPPTLLFFGTDDFLFKQGEEFIQRSKELGHRSEMFTAEKQPHAFFWKKPWLEKTTQRADEFLTSLGYLQGKATSRIPDTKNEKPKVQPKPKVPPPTFENVKYGPHERNVLDFWQAKSEQPTPVLVSIHGGGFVQGNKSVGPFILKDCLDPAYDELKACLQQIDARKVRVAEKRVAELDEEHRAAVRFAMRSNLDERTRQVAEEEVKRLGEERKVVMVETKPFMERYQEKVAELVDFRVRLLDLLKTVQEADVDARAVRLMEVLQSVTLFFQPKRRWTEMTLDEAQSEITFNHGFEMNGGTC